MFRQVFIVQCKKSGRFLTATGSSLQVNRAGLFLENHAALETAINELGDSFLIFSFYMRESEIPAVYFN